MRLAYLDEAGTSRKEPALAVAGVIISGDTQAMEVEKRIDLLRQRHIPEGDWDKVLFHATDIYHGKKYFDRRKPEWSDDWKRWIILVELAAIIETLELPIVTGIFEKDHKHILRKPRVLRISHLVQDVPRNDHRHHDGLARPGRHFCAKPAKLSAISRHFDPDL